MKRLLTIFLSLLFIMPAYGMQDGAPATGAAAGNNGGGSNWTQKIAAAGFGLGAAFTALVIYLKNKGFLKGLNIGPVSTVPESKPKPAMDEQAVQQARQALIEKYVKVVRRLSNIANTDDQIVMAKMNTEEWKDAREIEEKFAHELQRRYRAIAKEYAEKYPNKPFDFLNQSYFAKVQDDKFKERYFNLLIKYYRAIIRMYGSDSSKEEMNKLFEKENIEWTAKGKMAHEKEKTFEDEE